MIHALRWWRRLRRLAESRLDPAIARRSAAAAVRPARCAGDLAAAAERSLAEWHAVGTGAVEADLRILSVALLAFSDQLAAKDREQGGALGRLDPFQVADRVGGDGWCRPAPRRSSCASRTGRSSSRCWQAALIAANGYKGGTSVVTGLIAVPAPVASVVVRHDLHHVSVDDSAGVREAL